MKAILPVKNCKKVGKWPRNDFVLKVRGKKNNAKEEIASIY